MVLSERMRLLAQSNESATIEPGLRVGSLKLGDTQEEAFTLFPRKMHIDMVTPLPNCGTEYAWSDLSTSSPGNLIIRFKEGRVYQIESMTKKYRTKEGITSTSTPEAVEKKFRGLEAYQYLGPTSEVEGERPLIMWTSRGLGIAFEFAYSRLLRQRYVYKVVVFRANGDFCPEGQPLDADYWQQLAPYALEGPNRKAMRSNSTFGSHFGAD